MDFVRINFDKELIRGAKTYNEKVGRWWLGQAGNSAHGYAYRKIADYIRALYPASPRLVIDYGCGPGHLLVRMMRRFTNSRFIGLDGSSLQLNLAEKRLLTIGRECLNQVTLMQTRLPNFDLDIPKADLVIFAFPNICPHSEEQPYYDKHGYRHRGDASVARYLAKAREPNPEDETVTCSDDELFDSLMTGKVISRNLRGLLKRGGLCVRIEYANAPRHELSDLVRLRWAFEDGSLSASFNGRKSERLFTLLHSDYYRSGVIEDVYHQTRDESDKTGGYFISVLRAV